MWIERPGTEGKVSDLGAHEISARALANGSDIIKPNGIVRQRRGWPYDGTTADVADNLVGVYRAKFALAAVTRTVSGDDDGDLFIHNASAAGSALFAGSVPFLPRAVYHDELIFCAQDGLTPLRRYSGASVAGTYSDTTGAVVTGEGVVTTLVASVASGVGSYAHLQLGQLPSGDPRVLRGTTTAVTLEDARAGGGEIVGVAVSLTGTTYPAVAIYNTGTATSGGGAITGYGTGWNSDVTLLIANSDQGDAVLLTPPDGAAVMAVVGGVSSDTSIGNTIAPTVATKSAYSINRRCPFKDVAAHKGRLFGTGVAQYKSRVYVGSVGWNLSAPPGFGIPWSMFSDTDFESQDGSDFLMDYVDVPAPNDSDECVALVSSANPLIVLKRDSAHGIPEDAPPFGSTLLPNGEGAGCIDVRSAWRLPIGPVWASQQGVLAYVGGTIRDLSDNRINKEWRALVADFDYGTSDFATIGWADGVMVVSIITGAGATKRAWYVYPYDDSGKLNPAWYPVTNISPRFAFSSSVAGEEEKLLIVQDDDQGRVIDLAPSINATGIARDGDGTSPALDMTLGSNLARLAGANVDERVLEVAVEANLQDSGGASSTLGGSLLTSQSLDSDATITTSLSSMASKTTDLAKPYVHKIGTKGGLQQLRLTKSATQTTEVKSEVTRIGVTVRASKRPL